MPVTPGQGDGGAKPGTRVPGLGTLRPGGFSSYLRATKPKKPKKGRVAKAAKGSKAKKAKAPKVSHARAHAARKPGTFHEQAGAGSAGGASSAILGGKGTGLGPGAGHPAGTGMAAEQLEGGAGGFGALPGLSGVLIDLVGEGRVGIDRALVAWQRESERVTNRAWRRPGGLQRMGGL